MPNNILKEFIFFQNSYVNTTRLKILNMIKKNSVPFYSQAKQELRGTISGHFRRFTPRPNKSSNKSSVATSRYVPNTFLATIFFFIFVIFFNNTPHFFFTITFFDHHFFSIFLKFFFLPPLRAHRQLPQKQIYVICRYMPLTTICFDPY